jgi:hypothetical protein
MKAPISLDEQRGEARLRRADSTAGGGASAASVFAQWEKDTRIARLASLESGLDGISPHRPRKDVVP